jgi:hypothetical protein
LDFEISIEFSVFDTIWPISRTNREEKREVRTEARTEGGINERIEGRT